MTTTFTSLCADDVYVALKALCDVLRVADHVHVEDAVPVQPVDDMLGRDTDGGDEEFGSRFDDDIDELVELALGVIVAIQDTSISQCLVPCDWFCAHFVFRALPPTCGIKRSTPNGAFLSFRKLLSSAICSRSMSGV